MVKSTSPGIRVVGFDSSSSHSFSFKTNQEYLIAGVDYSSSYSSKTSRKYYVVVVDCSSSHSSKTS